MREDRGMPHPTHPPGLAPALAVLVLSACGTSVSETYVNDPPATMVPRGPRSVRIYASGPPARPHLDVAILQAVQTHGFNEQGLDIMLDQLRARAAELGCDGVVVGGIRERDGFPPDSGFYLLDPGATTLHATCIAFTSPPPAKKPPPPPAPAVPVGEPSRPSANGCACGAP
jgi:hypothetical protein